MSIGLRKIVYLFLGRVSRGLSVYLSQVNHSQVARSGLDTRHDLRGLAVGLLGTLYAQGSV